MATRTITGTIYHAGSNYAWINAVVRFRMRALFTVPGITYPTDEFQAVTNTSGAFSVSIAVPDDGSTYYDVILPDGAAITVSIQAGTPITLDELINEAASTGIPQNTLQAAIDAHSQSTNVHTFTGLTDAPDSYVGQAFRVTRVKSDETGLEFAAFAGTDKYYLHTQLAPATVWTINHNLGKNPAITIIDSSGNVVFGDVKYTVDNITVTAAFSAPFGGIAYCN